MSELTTKGTIEQFLQPIRARMSKEAAAEDNSVSHMDTNDAKPEQQAKPKPGHTEQNNLGKEQKADAHDGGANADSVPENSEADGQDYADTAGINTLDTDDKVVDKGNIGPMRHQAITQEQKMARADRLADGILGVLEATFSKKAGCEIEIETGDDDDEEEEEGGQFGDDYANSMASDEDKEASAAFNKIASVAQSAAADYYDGFILGMLKRAQDEADLRAANLPPEVLQKVGGIEGLLDKVAMEDPMAVLPEEALAADPAAGGELPPEAGMEGGMEGGDMDALAGELDAAGVTPEDLEAAMQDVAALQEQGVSPEEIAQALGELGGGEAGPAPVEGGEELPKEASVARQRIDQIKVFLTR